MIPKIPNHKRIKPKLGKATPAERKYWERLRGYGCQVPWCCGMPVSIHHDPYLSQGGNHQSVVALCQFHHQDQKYGRHAMSRERFNEMYNMDILELAKRNKDAYYED